MKNMTRKHLLLISTKSIGVKILKLFDMLDNLSFNSFYVSMLYKYLKLLKYFYQIFCITLFKY